MKKKKIGNLGKSLLKAQKALKEANKIVKRLNKGVDKRTACDKWLNEWNKQHEDKPVNAKNYNERIKIDIRYRSGELISYPEYLNSQHWYETRREALKKANHKCEVCGCSGSLDIHHLSYKRMWCELPTDLIALCRDCHHKIHGVDIFRNESVKATSHG